MRAFILNSDLEEINSWLKAHGKEPMQASDIPKFGMIEEGIACGFLCFAEGNTCFLEAFITNPEVSSKERNIAINKIVKWLLGVAAAADIKQCLVISNEMSLIKRAEDLGFEIKDIFIGKKIL